MYVACRGCCRAILGFSGRKYKAGFVMAEILDVAAQHKCAYSPCKCQVSSAEKYCSEYCSDADEEHEVEIQCDCKHSPCMLD